MSRRSEGAGNETLEVQAQNIAELLLAKKNIAQKQTDLVEKKQQLRQESNIFRNIGAFLGFKNAVTKRRSEIKVLEDEIKEAEGKEVPDLNKEDLIREVAKKLGEENRKVLEDVMVKQERYGDEKQVKAQLEMILNPMSIGDVGPDGYEVPVTRNEAYQGVEVGEEQVENPYAEVRRIATVAMGGVGGRVFSRPAPRQPVSAVSAGEEGEYSLPQDAGRAPAEEGEYDLPQGYTGPKSQSGKIVYQYSREAAAAPAAQEEPARAAAAPAAVIAGPVYAVVNKAAKVAAQEAAAQEAAAQSLAPSAREGSSPAAENIYGNQTTISESRLQDLIKAASPPTVKPFKLKESMYINLPGASEESTTDEGYGSKDSLTGTSLFDQLKGMERSQVVPGKSNTAINKDLEYKIFTFESGGEQKLGEQQLLDVVFSTTTNEFLGVRERGADVSRDKEGFKTAPLISPDSPECARLLGDATKAATEKAATEARTPGGTPSSPRGSVIPASLVVGGDGRS